MTPPDSGEHMRCADPDCDLCAAIRAIKPDSGEREVCGAPFDDVPGVCRLPRGHGDMHEGSLESLRGPIDPLRWSAEQCPTCLGGKDAGQWMECSVPPYVPKERSVPLPLPLAQRILAALDNVAGSAFHREVAAELRAIVERKT